MYTKLLKCIICMHACLYIHAIIKLDSVAENILKYIIVMLPHVDIVNIFYHDLRYIYIYIYIYIIIYMYVCIELVNL